MTTIRHPQGHDLMHQEWVIGVEVIRSTVLVVAAILAIIVALPALLDLASTPFR